MQGISAAGSYRAAGLPPGLDQNAFPDKQAIQRMQAGLEQGIQRGDHGALRTAVIQFRDAFPKLSLWERFKDFFGLSETADNRRDAAALCVIGHIIMNPDAYERSARVLAQILQETGLAPDNGYTQLESLTADITARLLIRSPLTVDLINLTGAKMKATPDSGAFSLTGWVSFGNAANMPELLCNVSLPFVVTTASPLRLTEMMTGGEGGTATFRALYNGVPSHELTWTGIGGEVLFSPGGILAGCRSSPPANLNGKVAFRNVPGEKIVCRHLSLQYALDSENDRNGKVPLRAWYSSPADIRHHIPWTRDAGFQTMTRLPPAGTCVVRSSEFGRVLNNLFRGMGVQKRDHAVALLVVDDHAMAVRLRIKEMSGQKAYVVSVYDPNVTGHTWRYSATSPEWFPAQCPALSRYSLLSPDTAGYIRSASVAVLPVTPGVWDRQGITADCTPPGPEASALALQMLLGLDADVCKMTAGLVRVPKEQRAELLRAVNSGGVPALTLAMQDGHVDAIRAWLEGLKQVASPQARTELLRAVSSNGVPALHMAMQDGHVDAIRAWLEGLKQVESPLARAELLRAVRSDGVPALHMAMQNGHAEAVRAWLEGLKQVASPQARTELLRAVSSDGVPALILAMQDGHVDAICAWLEGVAKAQLSIDQRVGLLQAEVKGVPALRLMRESGNVNAVRAWKEGRARVPVSVS